MIWSLTLFFALVLFTEPSSATLPRTAYAPYVPTPPFITQLVLQMTRLDAALAATQSEKSDKLFVDLGSGDGCVVIEAVKSGLFTRGLGIEREEWLVQRARDAAAKEGQQRTTEFRTGDLLVESNLAGVEEASVLYLALLPQIVDGAWRTLGDGAIWQQRTDPVVVLSIYFPLLALQPDESYIGGSLETRNLTEPDIYKYIIHPKTAEKKSKKKKKKRAKRSASVSFALAASSPLPVPDDVLRHGSAPPTYRFHKKVSLRSPLQSDKKTAFGVVVTLSLLLPDANYKLPRIDAIWAKLDDSLTNELSEDAAEQAMSIGLRFVSITVGGSTDARAEGELQRSDDDAYTLAAHLKLRRKIELQQTDEVVVVVETYERDASVAGDEK
jgi:hypothetical protein